ncbi:MAG: thiol-disulfide oxidoreductase DCC family protein [Synechococcus sp.]
MTTQSSATAPQRDERSAAQQRPTWQIELLFDGDCPLCVREVNFLRRKDAGRGIISFVDIAALDYNPQNHAGIDFKTAMGVIHAVKSDGAIIRGVDVFRQVYDALGIGWIYAATRWPVVGPLVDKLYELWADRRLAVTGRPNLNEIVRMRQQAIDECSDRCQVD